MTGRQVGPLKLKTARESDEPSPPQKPSGDHKE